MIVNGTATIEFSVEIDVEDISTEVMSVIESDELIQQAIYDKYSVFADYIHVYNFKK